MDKIGEGKTPCRPLLSKDNRRINRRLYGWVIAESGEFFVEKATLVVLESVNLCNLFNMGLSIYYVSNRIKLQNLFEFL